MACGVIINTRTPGLFVFFFFLRKFGLLYSVLLYTREYFRKDIILEARVTEYQSDFKVTGSRYVFSESGWWKIIFKALSHSENSMILSIDFFFFQERKRERKKNAKQGREERKQRLKCYAHRQRHLLFAIQIGTNCLNSTFSRKYSKKFFSQMSVKIKCKGHVSYLDTTTNICIYIT